MTTLRRTSIGRRRALALIGGAVALPASARAAAAARAPLVVRTMRVPFDHDRPDDGTFALSYALLRAFDPRRPTVAVVTDGQQFFVTPAAFGPAMEPLFDDRFNVVGVFGRGMSPDVQRRIGAQAGAVDWTTAYRLLTARQWIGDLEAMRRELLGSDGTLLLYGRSGGAMMAHQYLTRYGSRIARAFTQAAVDQYVAAAFGLESDRFWDELSADDRARLTSILRRGTLPRGRVIAVLQRQNFFVDRAHLDRARHDLIASLADGRNDLFDRLTVDYQVAAIEALQRSPLRAAISVRLFELEAPLAGRYDFTAVERIVPDHEAAMRQAAPLFAAAAAGRIPLPAWDHRPLHAVDASIVMIAGRWDHTCDYRTQIALASCYPAARLTILDDDHTFHRLNDSANVRDITLGALSAPASAEYRTAMSLLAPMRWNERS